MSTELIESPTPAPGLPEKPYDWAPLPVLKPITARVRLPSIYGAHITEVTVDGLTFAITYDLDGAYFAATETDPAEYPQVVVISVGCGDQEVFGADARTWDEKLSLAELVEAQR